ncbi:protein-L-isoaspartate O-methyltransferase family protein [Methylovirgula sp. 4M-Z18]|uniref:protein-L-isoaspartate O-methyltransferase family protein n=1 Tax=Methylovirgula sp. 4M-Z18 TaxID=2293567 RepID=UPI000E2F9B9A|nr:methyltransferase domain-containing protein [Methylovirgula sp. 4M-Z18]RFB79586.1 methyltransferase [Methylovirgula sp. 4M-Z18]
MHDRSANLRAFFASYVTKMGEARDPRIERAFASVPREPFAGKGPWWISVRGRGYLRTPDDDIAFLYQDALIALDPVRGINIGEPSSHAKWLDALELTEGETVLHVGAGAGYYTALLATLVGAKGKVYAYEIEPDLAARAQANLREFRQVEVHARSGIADDLPKADAVYVNAAITQPSRTWLDALRPRGRLLFPLHGPHNFGGMLRIERPLSGAIWPARFVSNAAFISCVGPQDPHAAERLTVAFVGGGAHKVRSFRTDRPIDETCWFKGDDWWLSTAEAHGANAS